VNLEACGLVYVVSDPPGLCDRLPGEALKKQEAGLPGG